ncbi:C1 family peptidase [Methanogenium cariaci]|uniref:C1 family peptidase n=1 Tax=Methanogenium cariaci TaxID=2197 RepID=UPI0007854513|nr:C1 family peptidase [Methanogenium cariaci]
MNLLHHLKATGALLCACLLAGFIVQGAFALEIEEAPPLNPEFVDYINHLDSVDENQMFTLNADSVPGAKNYPMGLVPPSPVSVNWSGAGAVNADSVIGSELCDLEAVFDLRTEGRVSPVHDQGNLGSCWAFASYGALESNLLPAGGVYDFRK